MSHCLFLSKTIHFVDKKLATMSIKVGLFVKKETDEGCSGQRQHLAANH